MTRKYHAARAESRPFRTDFDSWSSHVVVIAVHQALNHHRDRITRFEIHVGEENGAKAGPDDKRCTMEARLERRPPIAVRRRADIVESALHGAVRNMTKGINIAIGRSAGARLTRAHVADA